MTIAELRFKNKISQQKLAAELGVYQSTVSRWEKNIHSIAADDLIKLAQYFGVTTDELLGVGKVKVGK